MPVVSPMIAQFTEFESQHINYPLTESEKAMGNNLSMAMYQFSNQELEELRIILEYAKNMANRSYREVEQQENSSPGLISNVAAKHINTINSIIASRNSRG